MGGKFYVYEHWRPDRGECFYVGMGKGRRANVMGKRNWMHVAVQKRLALLGLAVEVRIIKCELTREEAFILEMERIAFWKNDGADLCNLTAGGEGSSDASESTRALMRAAKLGKVLTPAHRANIAAATKVALLRPETNAKLRAATKAANNTPEAKERASKHFKALVRTAIHRARIAASKTGVKQTPEHREKSRLASLGRKQRSEEIERRRVANTGKKRSPEFCQMMRELQMRPDIRERAAARMRAMNADPVVREANRLRLIERNKSWSGKKRPRKVAVAARDGE